MKKNELLLIVVGAFACLLMAYVETVLQPGYFIKSLLKAVIFESVIIVWAIASKKEISKLLNLKKMTRAKDLFLFVLLAYFTIVIGFFIFKNMMDLNSIKVSLIDKEHLTKQNCLWIFAYIILCNSFIEESFFRGFIFVGLKNNKKIAYIISGFLFAIYHIGIVGGWFNPFVFIVCILGLMIAGMVLDYVCERYDSLLASYIVHATANLAINTIGVYLMFIL